MPYDDFRLVDTWVFDLDNTLYPPSARLFDQIEVLMAAYVMRELGVDEETAHHLRRTYWQRHGTTLAGLVKEHGIDPVGFMDEVHEIDLSGLTEAPDLRAAITALPGRKVIYTNGSKKHAANVTRARGLDGVFDAMFGIEDAGYIAKPQRPAFDMVFDTLGLTPHKAAMFEDDARNLAVPHDLGMKTVLVGAVQDAAHVQHQTEDLAGFLARLVR